MSNFVTLKHAYPRRSTKFIARYVARQTGFHRDVVRAVLLSLTNCVTESLKERNPIELRNVGVFHVRRNKGRAKHLAMVFPGNNRSPNRKGVMVEREVKRRDHVKFHVSAKLKTAVFTARKENQNAQ